jgi:hypothetical protein
MSSITFDQLAQKFERLPEQSKKEAFDFIEFLLQKKKRKRKNINKKKILLGMSCWSDEDIKRLDDVREHMNKWEPETF